MNSASQVIPQKWIKEINVKTICKMGVTIHSDLFQTQFAAISPESTEHSSLFCPCGSNMCKLLHAWYQKIVQTRECTVTSAGKLLLLVFRIVM